jgi:DNA replication regulator SLD2
MIAQKYKDYNRIRDILSGKEPAKPSTRKPSSSPQRSASKKRKHEPHPIQTPSKRLAVASTPSKTSLHPANLDPYDSPSVVRNLFTPSHNRVYGPTPQKDGKVLGLFDLLSEKDVDSPSRRDDGMVVSDTTHFATPRKPTGRAVSPDSIRHDRTPASSGKRYMLDTFATPLKNKDLNEQGGRTPSSVSKLQFATPSFLRRGSTRTILPAITESGDTTSLSPEMVRLPRKPLFRGLSSIVANLRKIEEENADEDLEALREMEMEELGGPSMSKPVTKSESQATVLVGDSQMPTLLGGFDDEGKYDSEPEELQNAAGEGQPTKSYKKRGQKRTTRRVVMKPVFIKKDALGVQPQAGLRSSSPEGLHDDDDRGDDYAAEEAVPETQFENPTLEDIHGGNYNSDSESEYTASEGGTRYRRDDQTRKFKKVTQADGTIKKIRRVAATAHANFKALKLRNSGSKGTRHGVSSRFRRKR